MLQELHIQSNLPIIILTILVICAIVLGYLEFKKVHNMIDTINNRLDSLKNIKYESPKKEKEKNIEPQQVLKDPEVLEAQEKELSNEIETLNKESNLNKNTSNIDPLSAVMGGLPFGGFMLQTG